VSIDSALIVKRGTLPTTADLAAAIGEIGVTVVFPAEFELDQTSGGWVKVTIDGEVTGFNYAVDPIADLEEPLPAKARRYGDTLLSFGARGSLSAETVGLIQRVMGARWRAAAWIEEELVTPRNLASDFTPPEDMDPDLAATMRGTPAERAAATQRYVDKFYPPVEPDRKAQVAEFLRPLIIPLIIVAMFIAIFVWTRIQ